MAAARPLRSSEFGAANGRNGQVSGLRRGSRLQRPLVASGYSCIRPEAVSRVSRNRSVAALLEHLISAQQCRVRHIDADDGKPFNPLTIPPPDISAPLRDRSVGGVGIYFVARLMDDVA